MEYTKQNFISELKKMSYDELCGLTNINEAKKNNFSIDVIISFISNLLS